MSLPSSRFFWAATYLITLFVSPAPSSAADSALAASAQVASARVPSATTPPVGATAVATPDAAPAKVARIGRITKVSGSVQFIRADSIRREKADAATDIFEKYIILTGEQSAATLQLIDDSIVVIDQNSRLEARDSASFFQKAGIAYFDIKSRKTGASLKVGTEFAIIGVKGTQFIVNAANAETSGVALRTGRLDIEAPTGEFAIHRRKITNEFEEFLQQQQGGFDDYKKQLQEDFVEYKKSFTLEPLKTISVQGSKVVERAFTQAELAEFARFEALR